MSNDISEVISTVENKGIEALDLTNPEVFSALQKVIELGECFSRQVWGN